MSDYLVLKAVNKNGSSFYDGSFVYPETGVISAPEWRPDTFCGFGLHGWLWGRGDICDATHLSVFDRGVRWLVISVKPKDIIRLNSLSGGGKVKFSTGKVVLCTDDIYEASSYLAVKYRRKNHKDLYDNIGGVGSENVVPNYGTHAFRNDFGIYVKPFARVEYIRSGSNITVDHAEITPSSNSVVRMFDRSTVNIYDKGCTVYFDGSISTIKCYGVDVAVQHNGKFTIFNSGIVKRDPVTGTLVNE